MYYFAYASSMDLGQIRRLCGWHCHILGRAVLKDYDFCLESRGYSNIRPKEGSEVWGVLFETDEKALLAMDEFEGHPEVFKRTEAEVFDEDGKVFKVWVYFERGDSNGIRPNEKHFLRVLELAKDHKLPRFWISKLESFLKTNKSQSYE
jgi:gamma-glutamylcyclotransferase (GGCT)/AIG2-like uncharacterized protein YtfP